MQLQNRHRWCLRRRVLPQHTDHAGVMWHGAYVTWLEEARVEALASVGLEYSALSGRGLELPVVSLAIRYRQPLLHGELVEVWSEMLPQQGVRFPWRSHFMTSGGAVAAEAQVDLVLADHSGGPDQTRVLRRLPDDLAAAMAALEAGS